LVSPAEGKVVWFFFEERQIITPMPPQEKHIVTSILAHHSRSSATISSWILFPTDLANGFLEGHHRLFLTCSRDVQNKTGGPPPTRRAGWAVCRYGFSFLFFFPSFRRCSSVFCCTSHTTHPDTHHMGKRRGGRRRRHRIELAGREIYLLFFVCGISSGCSVCLPAAAIPLQWHGSKWNGLAARRALYTSIPWLPACNVLQVGKATTGCVHTYMRRYLSCVETNRWRGASCFGQTIQKISSVLHFNFSFCCGPGQTRQCGITIITNI
jgi:hypothetical protein